MARTAGELAEHLESRIEGDALVTISGVASPERAGAEDLIYLDSPRRAKAATASAARCVIAQPGVRIAGKTIIEASQPKLAFARAAVWLAPNRLPDTGIHRTAIVTPGAELAQDVFVGPYVVIEAGVQVGAGTAIEAFCFLGQGSRVGAHCHLHPRVTLYAGARLGNRVEVHSGAVIGGDGFGYVFAEGRHWKFPQTGGLEIEDDVEIGCNTTIDRGSLETTRIGQGAKIDNLVQVAHNVEIGEHSVIAAQTGVSGSSRVGKNVSIGGQAGIGDHCTIEDGSSVGGQAGVLPGKRIRSGQIVWGTPARPLDKFKEQYACLTRLPELAEHVRKLGHEARDR